MTNSDGLVIVDKPSAVTSHQVVGQLRRLLGIRKVGHAGTLDPMATGVLILGVGRATRLLGQLALHDKRYLATVRLGQRSDTDDAEGTVVGVATASGISARQLVAALDPLLGDILQVPSTVSAIKVDGRRAYARVRAGEEVVLKPRAVTISRLDILATRAVGECLDVDIDVECSSGTYIRAIARDLGESLGVGGHLTRLRRTRVGDFGIAEAVVLGDEAPELIDMAEIARRSMPTVMLTAEQSAAVRFGKPLGIELTDPLVGLISPGGQLLALYQPRGDQAVPISVLVGPNEEIALG